MSNMVNIEECGMIFVGESEVSTTRKLTWSNKKGKMLEDLFLRTETIYPMAIFSTSLPPFTTHPSSPTASNKLNELLNDGSNFKTSPLFRISGFNSRHSSKQLNFTLSSYRLTTRGGFIDDEEEDVESCSFEEAVELFNSGNYYKCHDVLEALWNKSHEPIRTLVHGILQCAVGLHHLFNQNHKGAMMELGEGLCKLRKMNFEGGPFHQFEKEISLVLEFIYQTQLEQAACSDDLCLAMDQSERSYQLLGGYAAGQKLYRLENDQNGNSCIVFWSERYQQGISEQPRIKIPVLQASEEHLMELEYN